MGKDIELLLYLLFLDLSYKKGRSRLPPLRHWSSERVGSPGLGQDSLGWVLADHPLSPVALSTWDI